MFKQPYKLIAIHILAHRSKNKYVRKLGITYTFTVWITDRRVYFLNKQLKSVVLRIKNSPFSKEM